MYLVAMGVVDIDSNGSVCREWKSLYCYDGSWNVYLDIDGIGIEKGKYSPSS